MPESDELLELLDRLLLDDCEDRLLDELLDTEDEVDWLVDSDIELLLENELLDEWLLEADDDVDIDIELLELLLADEVESEKLLTELLDDTDDELLLDRLLDDTDEADDAVLDDDCVDPVEDWLLWLLVETELLEDWLELLDDDTDETLLPLETELLHTLETDDDETLLAELCEVFERLDIDDDDDDDSLLDDRLLEVEADDPVDMLDDDDELLPLDDELLDRELLETLDDSLWLETLVWDDELLADDDDDETLVLLAELLRLELVDCDEPLEAELPELDELTDEDDTLDDSELADSLEELLDWLLDWLLLLADDDERDEVESEGLLELSLDELDDDALDPELIDDTDDTLLDDDRLLLRLELEDWLLADWLLELELLPDDTDDDVEADELLRLELLDDCVDWLLLDEADDPELELDSDVLLELDETDELLWLLREELLDEMSLIDCEELLDRPSQKSAMIYSRPVRISRIEYPVRTDTVTGWLYRYWVEKDSVENELEVPEIELLTDDEDRLLVDDSLLELAIYRPPWRPLAYLVERGTLSQGVSRCGTFGALAFFFFLSSASGSSFFWSSVITVLARFVKFSFRPGGSAFPPKRGLPPRRLAGISK